MFMEDEAYTIIDILTTMAEKRTKVHSDVINWVCLKIVRNKSLP